MNKWERAVEMESLDLLIIFTVFLLFFTSFALQSDSGNLTEEANWCDERIYQSQTWISSRAAAPMIEMVKLSPVASQSNKGPVLFPLKKLSNCARYLILIEKNKNRKTILPTHIALGSFL